MGVPVKPMNEALRQRIAHVPGEAVDQVVLAAVRFVGDDDDVPAIRSEHGDLARPSRAGTSGSS